MSRILGLCLAFAALVAALWFAWDGGLAESDKGEEANHRYGDDREGWRSATRENVAMREGRERLTEKQAFQILLNLGKDAMAEIKAKDVGERGLTVAILPSNRVPHDFETKRDQIVSLLDRLDEGYTRKLFRALDQGTYILNESHEMFQI